MRLPETHAHPLPWILRRSPRKKASLRVFLTGLFGNLEETVARRFTQLLQNTGSHVLALPNPWSRDYQQAKPFALPADLPAEVTAVRSALRQAMDRLGRDAVSSVDLIGVSYGGFLASATFALDQQTDAPLIDGTLTILSPPGELLLATAAVDSGFDALDPRSPCSQTFEILLAMDYGLARTERDLRPLSRACADFLLFGSFHKGLVTLAEHLHRNRGVGTVPDPAQSPAAYELWKQELTLSQAIDEFVLAGHPPSAEFLENSHLGTWGARTPEASRRRIRVLSSRDDFVNTGFDWNETLSKSSLPPQSLILLNWGGHFGFSGARAFEDFFKGLF